ncbi:MAG: hypothetical protein HY706_10545 [Candidatus Hydrogenedentes bacterium]|nr:hypothetical protein [Candidatus Hydrogenedentota bacterium]
MKKGCSIVFVVLAIVSCIVMVVAFVADNSFGIIRGAPRISYRELVTPQTSVQVVVEPLLAPELAARFLQPEHNVPTWALARVLPHQIAVLAEAALDSGQTKSVVFINEQRLGPLAAQRSEGALALRRRGVLVGEVTGVLPEAVVKAIRARWAQIAAIAAPAVEASHLLSLAFDNRQGTGFAAFLGSRPFAGVPPEQAVAEDTLTIVRGIGTITGYADLAPNDTLNVHLSVECNTWAQNPEHMFLLANMGLEELRARLKADYGIVLSGVPKLEGPTIQGDFTVATVEKLIAVLKQRAGLRLAS